MYIMAVKYTSTLHAPPEVTATLVLQPSNVVREDGGTIQACVVIAPADMTETPLTVDLRSLDGTASKRASIF